MLESVFVYGTLLPGGERWPLLAPYAAGPPLAAVVPGTLHDTGRGYPAAVFDGARPGIPGVLVPLAAATLAAALALLDEVEGVGVGLYRRVEVVTDAGEPAWSYAWGADTGGLTPIDRWT